jgi:integrase
MGHLRRTTSGNWQARYRDPTGRERARNFPRKIDAERFLALIEVEKVRGEWVDPEAGKVIVAEFSERWYATTVALKPKTRAGYRSLLDSRILPYIGHLQLRRVDPLLVREWIADLQEDGISASRIRQARNVIHAVFGLAQQASLIVRNPVEGIRTPPLPVADRRFLTSEQVRLLAASMPGRYQVLTYVLAYTGIRFGEAAALRRARCDVAASRLDIAESLAEVAGGLHFGSTKTHRHRTVAIPATIRNLLANHLDTVNQAWETLVFTSPTGQPLRYSNFRNRVWIPATEAAELPGLDIHELRHTAASLMIRAGADPKLIQTQLGHASIAVTYDVYGHLFPDRLDELADKLDELILRDDRSATRDRDIGRSL